MLIVPPLLDKEDIKENSERYISSTNIPLESTEVAIVRCPIANVLISEADCYEVQAITRGNSDFKEWIDSTTKVFENLFKRSHHDIYECCIKHQIEILRTTRGSRECIEKLEKRLNEILRK